MSELCKSIPEVGTAVLLDEMAKLQNLDFHNYGTFSPRDVEMIVKTLSPSMFTSVRPYTEKEVRLAELFSKQAKTPNSIARLTQLTLNLYEQAKRIKNNEELIAKLEFALSVYRTVSLLHWALNEIQKLQGSENKEKAIFLAHLLGKCMVIVKLMTTRGHAVAFAQGILLQPVVNLFKTIETGCKEQFIKGTWQLRLLQTIQTL
jgi:hypothetical protein